jgi:mycothiol synthase
MIIEPVRPDDLPQAMERALVRVPAEQRAARVQQCLDMVTSSVLDPRNIWVARLGSDIVAVQVCVSLSGAACLFWLPSTLDPIADVLIQAALTGMREQGCKVAQLFANVADHEWTAPLRRQGFQSVTRLHQMAHSLTDVPPVPPTTLRHETYRPSLAAQFAATLERTYVGTLDCPELNGIRTTEEVIAGHKSQGKFHPECWWLEFEGDRPVGVTMLVEMPDAMTWELAYFGLIPEARGRGLGRAMLLHAMSALLAHPAIALMLAVDARNVPARRLYQSLGFIDIETQDVLLYLW